MLQAKLTDERNDKRANQITGASILFNGDQSRRHQPRTRV